MLAAAVLFFGPTIYMISTITQTFGSFGQHFLSMSFFTDFQIAATSLDSWQDSWNGWWTVFIWCWVIAFSPFVAGFVARISRGRTIRDSSSVCPGELPSLIVMFWSRCYCAASIYYDDQTGRAISDGVADDTSSGLFLMLEQLPLVGTVMPLVNVTILVNTYYVTSLDAGTYALGRVRQRPAQIEPLLPGHPGDQYQVDSHRTIVHRR